MRQVPHLARGLLCVRAHCPRRDPELLWHQLESVAETKTGKDVNHQYEPCACCFRNLSLGSWPPAVLVGAMVA